MVLPQGPLGHLQGLRQGRGGRRQLALMAAAEAQVIERQGLVGRVRRQQLHRLLEMLRRLLVSAPGVVETSRG